MASLLRLDDRHDPVATIQQWQLRQHNVQVEAVGHSQIANLCQSLLELFREISLNLDINDKVPRSVRVDLNRSRSAFVLWCDGYGIAQGHFDDTFSKASKLRRVVTRTMCHMGEVLTERLVPHIDIWSDKLQDLCLRVRSAQEDAGRGLEDGANSESDDESTSGASSDASFSDDVNEIAQDLRTDTRCLTGLGPLLRNPVFDPEDEKDPAALPTFIWNPTQPYADKIHSRFPQADLTLISHLGNTNYERYLRCQAARDSLEGGNTSKATSLEFGAAGTLISGSKFHDSGIGTSIAPTVSYAETVMSYNNNEGRSVKIPPLPQEARAGVPFDCVACGRKVSIKNSSQWKRHIFSDLQPYACLDMACSHSTKTFASREQWTSHLALDHDMHPKWNAIQCSLCAEETGHGKTAVTQHLARHLEEISLSALPAGVDSNTTTENGSETGDEISERSDSEGLTKDATETGKQAVAQLHRGSSPEPRSPEELKISPQSGSHSYESRPEPDNTNFFESPGKRVEDERIPSAPENEDGLQLGDIEVNERGLAWAYYNDPTVGLDSTINSQYTFSIPASLSIDPPATDPPVDDQDGSNDQRIFEPPLSSLERVDSLPPPTTVSDISEIPLLQYIARPSSPTLDLMVLTDPGPTLFADSPWMAEDSESLDDILNLPSFSDTIPREEQKERRPELLQDPPSILDMNPDVPVSIRHSIELPGHGHPPAPHHTSNQQWAPTPVPPLRLPPIRLHPSPSALQSSPMTTRHTTSVPDEGYQSHPRLDNPLSQVITEPPLEKRLNESEFGSSHRLLPPIDFALAPASDRWARIRKDAVERASQRGPAKPANFNTPSVLQHDQDDDDNEEETIESRVARIKARVAELIGSQENEKADVHPPLPQIQRSPSPTPIYFHHWQPPAAEPGPQSQYQSSGRHSSAGKNLGLVTGDVGDEEMEKADVRPPLAQTRRLPPPTPIYFHHWQPPAAEPGPQSQYKSSGRHSSAGKILDVVAGDAAYEGTNSDLPELNPHDRKMYPVGRNLFDSPANRDVVEHEPSLPTPIDLNVSEPTLNAKLGKPDEPAQTRPKESEDSNSVPPRQYCMCGHAIPFREMAKCDRIGCVVSEWFHIGCLEFVETPRGRVSFSAFRVTMRVCLLIIVSIHYSRAVLFRMCGRSARNAAVADSIVKADSRFRTFSEFVITWVHTFAAIDTVDLRTFATKCGLQDGRTEPFSLGPCLRVGFQAHGSKNKMHPLPSIWNGSTSVIEMLDNKTLYNGESVSLVVI
ncbi:hypothetical protein QBC43DRAFT_247296 [Cladorrhinum sp. PSN259]|nr:hypothetical protein QBC43DRAFT_247296 [Cladorrhinum sp. PSN259]